ncbi:VanZ family protein [Thiocapsa marina]|uniref:VanZ family protein n=1 Tax=Thiocapsa marina 5811 TaxID=768671 RepID=F9UBB2_9GAMM|nr:VanZ family protein [Thiocapsa marina]EGV18230.1 VanZ family protein [Thiocapsa marina 5811]
MPTRGPIKILILIPFLLGYWAVGLYPFTFEPPKHVVNQAERTADGGLSFSGVGIACTPGAPEWLSRLNDTSRIEIRLVARTDDPDQRGPARLFTISDGVSDRNLTLGQEGEDLVIRVRRPGSDANGTPALQVAGLFRDAAWHAIRVRIEPDRLTVTVDGKTRVEQALSGSPFPEWNPEYALAMGNELPYGRAWTGEIRAASVEIDGRTIDVLDPVEIQLPGGWWEIRHVDFWNLHHDRPYYKTPDIYINFFGFIPFGALLMLFFGRRLSILHIMLLGAALSLSIETLQILLPRHPSVTDLVLNTLGAGVGAALARMAIRSGASA